jgi:hypothetical protein
MVEFPANFPIRGTQGAGDSNPYDTTPAFVQAVDFAWESINLLKNANPPNETMTQTVMTSINQLYAYLHKNPPPAGSCAANILASLTAGSPGISLESLCSTGDLAFIQANPDVFDVLMGNTELDGISSYRADNTNGTIEGDIRDLQGALAAYNANPNASNAEALAHSISQLEKDVKAASPQLSDGYLSTLLTYLNSPAPGGKGSLASLAQSYSTDPTDFTKALAGLGEGVSGVGSFSAVIADVINWEYNQ